MLATSNSLKTTEPVYGDEGYQYCLCHEQRRQRACLKAVSVEPWSFSRLFRGRKRCRCFRVELVKLLSLHRYSVDIFSYSGPSGILGSDRKENTA